MTLLKFSLKLLTVLLAAVVLLLVGWWLFGPGLHSSSIAMALNVMTGAGGTVSDDKLLAQLRVAEAYRVSIFARDIANPRMLYRTAAGRLLVSSPRSGEVVQLTDSDGDGAADRQTVLLSALRRPHGLQLYGEYLYIAESHQIGRVLYDVDSGRISGSYSPLVEGFTDDGNHWSKTLRIKQDQLYVAMGSTCNVCEEEDPRRATIVRYDLDGGGEKIYASGLRNSVGLAFAPWDGALYATDNGRDLLGDDFPPCELNRIEEGGFYGWPWLHGDNVMDPDLAPGNDALNRETLTHRALTPAFSFNAHNAPLGIHFIGLPERAALVALHGSWNRSTPDGYKVVKLTWHDDGSITADDFMWGFLADETIIGRPVDIAADGAGGFFVSDDYARVIYRLSRNRQLRSAARTKALPVEAPPVSAAVVGNAALISAGAALYHRLPCADCHAPGAATPVALEGLAARYSVASLTEYFLTPTPPMPQYPLSLQQRQQLAHYLLRHYSAPAEK